MWKHVDFSVRPASPTIIKFLTEITILKDSTGQL